MNPRHLRAKLALAARDLPPGSAAAIAFVKTPQKPQMKPGPFDTFAMLRFRNGEPIGGSAALGHAERALAQGARVTFAFDDASHARRMLKVLRGGGVR